MICAHASYRELWAGAAPAVGAEIESVGDDIFRIRRGDRQTFVRLSDVMLDDHLSLSVAGNKPLCYKLLAERGVRVPRHLEYDLGGVREAYRFVAALGTEAVVKPARDSGGGRGVTTGVRTYSQFERASVVAGSAGSDLLVEEEVRGSSFRLLYLDGELIDAVQRDAPRVTGDGKRSVRRLIADENQGRLNGALISALSPLTADLECRFQLAAQGLKLGSIPPEGRPVRLKTVVNQNSSFENHSVRDRIHPSLVQLGRDATAILGWKLAGVDLITPDITVPLSVAGGMLGEINTTPGLHHHYLVSAGRPAVPVAERVLDFVLSDTARRRWPAGDAGPVHPANA